MIEKVGIVDEPCWLCGDTRSPHDARRRCVDRAACDARSTRLAMYARMFGVNAPLSSQNTGDRWTFTGYRSAVQARGEAQEFERRVRGLDCADKFGRTLDDIAHDHVNVPKKPGINVRATKDIAGGDNG